MNQKAPGTENRTVPIRKANKDLRSREYLTPNEMRRLMDAARKNRRGQRDATMILLAYRHGLRASETCALRWDQFDMRQGTLHVNRLKNGIPSVHPLGESELRALRKLKREEPESRFLFLSERGAPMTAEGFRKMVRRAAEAAKFPFTIHPHMIRHACGYKLANEGRDTRAIQLYMGHRNIQNTVGYHKAAEQDLADAQFNLGLMYDTGESVPQDEAEAANSYRMAAEKGIAGAQNSLGGIYAKGDGVPQDFAAAVKWFRLAAEQGLAQAQFNLGIMYYNGRGVPQNDAEALAWYRKAAEQSSAGAQYNLGLMYGKEEGIPQDCVSAHMWFTLAAAQGQENALKGKDFAARLMTPDQIAEAQRMAREWLAKHQR